MSKLKRTAQIITFTLISALLASAQEARRPSVSTVNITPEAGRVRVAPVGSVSGLRIEVVNEAGDTVFESMQGAREQIDWHMRDSAGLRVPPGTYTVTVSYTTEAGKQRKRIEQVLVTEEVKGGAGASKTGVQPTPSAPSDSPQPLVDGGGTANRIPKFTDTDTLTSSVIMDVSGRVGIGTAAAPLTGIRLEVNGITKLTPGGTGGYMQFGTPNAETGLTWLRPAKPDPSPTPATRADIRFNGDRLMLAAAVGAGVPNNSGLVIDTTGKVGIGLPAPDSYRLHVNGGSLTAVYGISNDTGVRGQGGTFGVYGNGRTYGVYGFTGSGDYGVYGQGGTNGVYGIGNINGVHGKSDGSGVYGEGNTYGVYGEGPTGVRGEGSTGVSGQGSTHGVFGDSPETGVYGRGSIGVRGFGAQTGVYGDAQNGAGAFGQSHSSAGWGVYGRNRAGGFAGFFDGKVHVAGAFTYGSDRNMKTNFSAVNPRSILQKLSTLPVQTWSYKTEGADVRHLGPVAQDFRAAFGLGADDKSIGAVDASGVALAAIQGLYQLLLEKDRKIERLQARVALLERAAKRGRREARPRSRR